MEHDFTWSQGYPSTWSGHWFPEMWIGDACVRRDDRGWDGWMASLTHWTWVWVGSGSWWWTGRWHPTPVLLPGKSHGRRNLVGYSPWGWEESDTTEWLHFHFSLSCIGEGNGNPLQCSCLENPGDGVAWWASVCGLPAMGSRRVRHDWSDLAAAAFKSCEPLYYIPVTYIIL